MAREITEEEFNLAHDISNWTGIPFDKISEVMLAYGPDDFVSRFRDKYNGSHDSSHEDVAKVYADVINSVAHNLEDSRRWDKQTSRYKKDAGKPPIPIYKHSPFKWDSTINDWEKPTQDIIEMDEWWTEKPHVDAELNPTGIHNPADYLPAMKIGDAYEKQTVYEDIDDDGDVDKIEIEERA